jgi:hypothetical protein
LKDKATKVSLFSDPDAATKPYGVLWPFSTT